MTLNSAERMYLRQAWELENLYFAKYNVYADMCQDQTLSRAFFDIAQRKLAHASSLKQLLDQS